MPFTESERSSFIAALTRRGWQVRDGVVWSPGGGLYFNSSHFAQWNPEQMKEVFMRRAARVEKLAYEGAAKNAAENRDVHLAVDEVVSGKNAS